MKQIITLFGLLFIVSSCVKNNPDPVWIEINEWTLEANPSSVNDPGELTENFSDAWVYIGGEFVGVFELPCKIPVLYTGSKTISVYPTIWNNGISATKKIYPFVEYYELTANLVANQTITINPTTRYKSTLQFWKEDFEGAFKIEDDPNSQTNITPSADPAIIQPFNGNQFGRVTLSSAANTWIAYTNNNSPLNLPKGAEVYLEIDYHNTNRVTTGLLAVAPSGTIDNPNIQLNPQEGTGVEWKKIYIDLREIISASAIGAYFQLSFQALLDDTETDGEINIDNIRVVYF